MSHLASKIHARRQHLGLSLRAASDRCGFKHWSTMARVEKYPEKIRWDLVVQAIEGLGGRVDVELSWMDQRPIATGEP